MPKLPRNVRKHGRRYEFRAVVNGKTVVRDLGEDPQEMRRLARFAHGELRALRQEQRPATGTLKEFSVRWLEQRIAQGRNAKGQELAAQRLRDYVLKSLEDLDLTEITLTDLRVLRAELEGLRRTDGSRRLSVASVRHILGDVRSLLRYAMDCGVIARSPWSPSLMPRAPERAPRPLSAEEVQAILISTPVPYQFAVRFALLTGLRWGEQHRARWCDVKELPYPHLLVEKTKSGRIRRVPLVEEAVELLQNHESTVAGEYLDPWRAPYPGHAVNTIRRLSGVHFTWHQFRHTFACRWLEARGSKESLQMILGHSTILQTEQYGRLSDNALFAEADRISLSLKVGQKVGQDSMSEVR